MKNGGKNKSVAFIILVSVYIYIYIYIIQWRTVGFQSGPSVSNCKLHAHILHISVTANAAICI